MKTERVIGALTCVFVLLVARPADAIRPFVTDDARVVGDKLAQLETWLVLDRLVLEHNALGAIGPTHWFELTLGVTHGGVHSGPNGGYSIAGPMVQGKVLLLPARNNSWPGVAIAAGVVPPLGWGAFVPPGWSGFAYLALTESLWNEWLLLHANVGIAIDGGGSTSSMTGEGGAAAVGVGVLVTAGLGVQARIYAGLHGVAEVYYGDPYDPRASFPATQVGFRYIFSDRVQIDGTFGSTLAAVESSDGRVQTEQWGTLGIRLVTPELW